MLYVFATQNPQLCVPAIYKNPSYFHFAEDPSMNAVKILSTNHAYIFCKLGFQELYILILSYTCILLSNSQRIEPAIITECSESFTKEMLHTVHIYTVLNTSIFSKLSFIQCDCTPAYTQLECNMYSEQSVRFSTVFCHTCSTENV